MEKTTKNDEKQASGTQTDKAGNSPRTPVEDVFSHYEDAKSELGARITHKERGFDTYDRIYRNFIDKTKWPFSARVPDGRGKTLIDRKTDRLLANRLAGRMVPQKTGKELGAMVATEVIHHQWNQVDMRTNETMLSRWRKMDKNTRKYGASFGLAKWRDDGRFDGPIFEPLENRNVLLEPGASSLDECEWVQVRRYVTIAELLKVNDTAKSGPVYDPKIVSQLAQKDERDYTSINREVIGLGNTRNGSKRIELVTEYRRDRWITFTPKQGTESGNILRDIQNPYKHGMIPIVQLVYDSIDDDIYGVPELENVLPLIKANWALISQYLDQAQIDLMSVLMVNPNQAQLDTLVFESGARWLMNAPGKDVVKFDTGSVSMGQFQGVYGLLTSLIMEGVGETGQDVSVLGGKVQDKTATEVRDLANLRTARDNSQKAILAQAISKMVFLWHEMNKQFMTVNRSIRIAGKDALKYFIDEGLHNWALSDAGAAMVSSYAEENEKDFDEAYEELRMSGALEQYAEPIFDAGQGGEKLPKLILDRDAKGGFLTYDKDDLNGDYDYVVDIEAMSLPNDQGDLQARQLVSGLLMQAAPMIKEDGFRVKWKEFIEDLGEKARLKNMDQYFDTATNTPPEGINSLMAQQDGQDAGNAIPQGAGVPGEGIPQF